LQVSGWRDAGAHLVPIASLVELLDNALKIAADGHVGAVDERTASCRGAEEGVLARDFGKVREERFEGILGLYLGLCG